jgi:hypothetical protein
MEFILRAPLLFANTITTPTFVFEGTTHPCNIKPLRTYVKYTKNPQVHFYEVPGYDHFSELAKFTPLIADQIVGDTAPLPNFKFQAAIAAITQGN